MSARPVTVDTGGPYDLYRGALIIWRRQCRGGYGFVTRIPAVVERVISKERVTIRVDTSGRPTRTVRVANVEWRAWLS